MRTVALISMALLALGAGAATSAQALEQPYYEISHKRLLGGETIGLLYKKTLKSYVFKLTGGIVVTCTGATLKVGVLNGSNSGFSGKLHSVIEFKGCTQTGNGLLCLEVTGKAFNTAELEGALALNPAKTRIEVYFKEIAPNGYATINFTGVCNHSKVAVKGSIAAEYIIGGKPVEVGKEPAESRTPEFNFPAVSIKELLVEGSPTTAQLESEGGEDTEAGESETEVSTHEEWGAYT
jgi:hypothetical protein